MRATLTAPSKEIIDAGRPRSKRQPFNRKAKRLKTILKKIKRAPFNRRDRRATDQILRQRIVGDGMLSVSQQIIDRGFGTGFFINLLMITAQANDGPGLLSASGLPGKVPGTTTE